MSSNEVHSVTVDPALVSVIVVNCNGAEDLSECLRSIRDSQPEPLEVIVVDNGSTDGSDAVIKGASLMSAIPIRCVALEENLGPAAARNIGVARAQGEYLAFLDNDTVVNSDWLVEALATMSQLGAACVQCKLVLKANPDLLDSVGYLAGPLGFPRHLVRIGEPDREELRVPRMLFGVKSAAMVMAREAFERAGGFDPTFFIYGEETDLCWRIMRTGGKIALAPTSIVRHRSAGTKVFMAPRAADLLYRCGTRNYIRVVAKNAPWWRLLTDLPGQILVWAAVSVFLQLRGDADSARLVRRGVSEGVRELPRVLDERRNSAHPFIEPPRGLRMGFTLGYLRRTARAV